MKTDAKSKGTWIHRFAIRLFTLVLEKQVTTLARQIENQTEKQRVVGDSSRNLQQTINQLIELQKLGC